MVYYLAADVSIVLSAFDTFGMVVLEAMAAGLPVIVSPSVGAKDLMAEGVNGYILPSPQDVEVWRRPYCPVVGCRTTGKDGFSSGTDGINARLGEVGRKDG